MVPGIMAIALWCGVGLCRAEAATTVDALVADFMEVATWEQQQSGGSGEDVPTTRVPFENSRFQRLERDVKDRYAALYQEALYNSVSLPQLPREDEFRSWSLQRQLSALRQRTFIATKSDWKERLVELSAEYRQLYIFVSKALRRFHTSLQSSPPPPHDPSKPSPSHSAQDASPDMLPTVFDVTKLPTHQELYAVFPWLRPVNALYHPPQPVCDRSMLSHDTTERELVVPLSWVYFYSTPHHKLCEVFNREYVDALAQYLVRRLESVVPGSFPVTVLEVGAGNGVLAHFVSEALSDLTTRDVRVVATDMDGNVGDAQHAWEVLRMDHATALEEFQPEVVLCSWMSMGVDLTTDMRRTDSVFEYILIGESDYGVSGDARSTWGIGKSVGVPSFEKEGFERVDLHDVSLWQVARSDSPLVRFHSVTTSFRRNDYDPEWRENAREEL